MSQIPPRQRPRGRCLALLGVLLCLACGEPPQRSGGPAVGWPAYGGDAGARRYSPLAEISPDNVAHLERVWEFHTGDLMEAELGRRNHAFQATPILVDDALYVCTPRSWVVALDARTDEPRWRFDPEVDLSFGHYNLNCRGVAAWRDPDAAQDTRCATRIYLATADTRLITLDAHTGTPCDDFGDAGVVEFFRDMAGPTTPCWIRVFLRTCTSTCCPRCGAGALALR